MPKKLTQRYVDSMPLATDKPIVVRALEPKGLMVRVGKASKTYSVQRELWVGERGSKRLVKVVRVTLGRTDELTLDEAVTRALDVLSQVRRGIDPNAKAEAPAGLWTVQRAIEHHAAEVVKGGGSERTAAIVLERMNRYLTDWLALPIGEITPFMWVERHAKIMKDVRGRAKNVRATGATAANQTMRDFRYAYNRVAKIDPSLPRNPTHAVQEAHETGAHHRIDPNRLHEWCKRIEALPSQLRQWMHLLGLFSGLRPGNLVAIERSWIDLEKQVIRFPRAVMKARRKTKSGFDLPLSGYMVGIVREALELGDMLHSGSPFLFPTKNRGGTEVIATTTWQEKDMPGETGHALRHTWSNCANLARVPHESATMLMAHRVAGVRGQTYLDQPDLFPRLLEDQEAVTAFILGKLMK